MVLACIVPAWLGIVFLIVSMYVDERERAVQNTIVTARTLMVAVDRELAAMQSALEVLATADELTSGDFAGFHRRASELSKRLPCRNIVLADETQQQIVNTLRPFGEPLPRNVNLNPDSLKLVFSAARPTISDLFFGPVAKEHLMSITIPVIRGGAVKYSLAIGLLPEKLGEILVRQTIPSGWVASIFDTAGVIVARNQNAQQLVGQRGAPDLVAAISRKTAGFVATDTVEGIPVYAAFVRSDLSSWAVAIGLPTAYIDGPLYASLGLSAAGALCLLAIALGFARVKAKQITSDVQALIHPAMAFGGGAVPIIPRLSIREVDDVAQALGRAFQILEKRTNERDRAEMEKQVAERTAHLKDEFIGTVSHELRTPLTSISASLALLVDTPEINSIPGAGRLVVIAYENCQRLVRLINDILDIEKLEADKMPFDLQPVEIPSLLEQVVESNRTLAEQGEVNLTLVSAPNCAAQVDPDRLTQVFSNLLSNAIKFSPRKSDVVMSVERVGESIRSSFRDHGSGIPHDFKARIFEKFAQAANGRQKGGTGLGLSIASEIVRRLGGEIGFDDAPGGGAIFFVVLPALDATGEATGAKLGRRHAGDRGEPG